MTESPRRWGQLTAGSTDPARRGARRRNLAALAVSVLGHALLFARLHHDPPAQPATAFQDVGAMSVGLVSFTGETTKAPLAPPSQTQVSPPDPVPPEDPKPAPEDPKSVSLADMALRALPPLDPTAKPIALTQPAAATPMTAATPPTAAASGPACNPVGAMVAAVQANSQVMADLPRIPRSAKPVADTLMIWQDHWLPIAAPGFGKTSDSLHQTITEIVRDLSADCRTQPIVGPRLLFVADRTGTTVLALGTGSWTWADLLRDSPAASR